MCKTIEMIGKKFNKWTVISESESKNGKRYNCVCECGNTGVVRGTSLRNNTSKSCGCIKADKGPKLSLVGEKFGMLYVDSIAYNKNGVYYYNTICACGNEKIIRGTGLTYSGTKSCGCLQKSKASVANTKHGMYKSREYNIYNHIKNRCYNQSSNGYNNYGGRGIKMCDRWLESFENFYEDMGDVPPNYSIERLNVNGNYEQSNCIWADNSTQARNKRNSLIITIDDNSMCFEDWKKYFNCGTTTLPPMLKALKLIGHKVILKDFGYNNSKTFNKLKEILDADNNGDNDWHDLVTIGTGNVVD